MDVTKTCRDLNELLPEARGACALFLAECKKRGIDIFITETYRSQARQNYLYQQGRTRAGIQVTWTLSSNHTPRLAWDIATVKKDAQGKPYHIPTLEAAGQVAKELGIEWGGTWAKIDRPHFQIKKGQVIKYKGGNEVQKQQKIKLNGVTKEVTVIEKDGNNYVKLQDIRDHFIKIDYDPVAKIPVIEARS